MLLGKNYGFSILVFLDNTSKNQDFFITFSASMSNFSTFQDQCELCLNITTVKCKSFHRRAPPFLSVVYDSWR